MTIEVSATDFKKTHKGLVHLLKTIDKAGGSISTRKLLEAMNNWGAHGNSVITKAEKQEYIKRVTGESQHGHFPPVYNVLTRKGKKLLEKLE